MSKVKKAKRAQEREGDHLTAGGIWKGENESDAEQVEGFDINPLVYVRKSSPIVVVGFN